MSSATMPLSHLMALNVRATKIMDDSKAREERKGKKTADARTGSWAWSYARTLPDLFFLTPVMDCVIADFRSTAWLNNVPHEDMKKCAHLVGQCSGKVSSIIRRFEKAGISGVPIYRQLLDRAARRNERLETIAEGLRMSLSAEFGEMMMSAANELDRIRDSSERGLVVGKL